MSNTKGSNLNLENQLEKLVKIFYMHFRTQQIRKKNRTEFYNEAIKIAGEEETLFNFLKITQSRILLEEFVKFRASIYDPKARENIASNSNAPMDILFGLRNDSHWVQLALASNPSLSTEMLEHMSKYSSYPDVKSRAKERASKRKNRPKAEIETYARGEESFPFRSTPYIVLPEQEAIPEGLLTLEKDFFRELREPLRHHTSYVAHCGTKLYLCRIDTSTRNLHAFALAEIEKVSETDYRITNLLTDRVNLDEVI